MSSARIPRSCGGKAPCDAWYQLVYVRLDRITHFTDIPKTTVYRRAGIDFPVFYINQKVRLAKRVDIDEWIESGKCFLEDNAAIDRLRNRRTRPTAGASTPELDAEQDEALRAYERFMES